MRYVDTRRTLPSPLPLHLTPWLLRQLGYPVWRMRDKKGWAYLRDEDYRTLFGRAPRAFGPSWRFI